MIRLVHAEFLKLRTTQVWLWFLALTVAAAAVITIVQVTSDSGIRYDHQVPELFSVFASTPAYVLIFVLGVLGVTTEFRYQTITPTLLQTPSRWTVVTAKMITYAIVGGFYGLVALLVEGFVGVPWLKSRRDLTVHFGDGEVQHAIFGTFGVLALFGIIGLGVGALLRNQIVAVTVGVIFLAVVENAALAIPHVKYAFPYLPNGAVQAILTTDGSRTVNDVTLLSTGGGFVVLVLWAFVPAILGAAVTLNRDIT